MSEWADKYTGKFDDGWEALREETFRRQKEMGWIPEDAQNTAINPTMQPWEDVPEEQRAFQTRLMEVFRWFPGTHGHAVRPKLWMNLRRRASWIIR